MHDLDAAADLYRRIGFKVGARNRHPWGTHNYIVQLPGFFIELLTVAEPDKLGDDGISMLFGKFNQEFLVRREGLSLLVLESHDAQADVEAFSRAGISGSGKLDFERDARRPDGTPIKVAFSLAFARDKAAPDIQFMTCQQHYPENFWNPAFQDHPNGVCDVRAVVMIADQPEAHRAFLAGFTGGAEFYTEPGEVSVFTPRGAVCAMTPARFAAAFGGPLPPAGNRMMAIRFAVGDVVHARAAAKEGGVPVRDHRDGFVIDGADAMGAVLSFEPSAKPGQ